MELALILARALGLDTKLGKLLGGDKGAEIATKVVAAAQQVVGSDDPAKITAAVQDPTVAAQLAIKMHELALQADAAAFADTANARAMQLAALQQDDLFSKRFIYFFATGWSIIGITYIFAVTFCTIPAGNTRFADTAEGMILGTVIASILQFFFGSSRSSQRKDAALGQLAASVAPKQ